MPQVRLDPASLTGDRFVIHGPEAHHLIRVLRRKAGDEIQLFDGQGRQYKGLIHRIDLQKLRVEGRIQETIEAPKKAAVLALYQGLPKGSKFDYVVEKAVELGVDEIVPYLSDKSLIQLEEKDRKNKAERWTRLVEAAAKQCGRPDVPRISAAQDFMEIKWDKIGGVTLAFSLDPAARPLKDYWKEQAALAPGSRFNVVIGPESALSQREEEHLVKSGAVLISMGKNVFRTETAGLVALSLLRYEMGLL